MTVSLNLLRWAALEKQEQALCLYLACRAMSSSNAGYFKFDESTRRVLSEKLGISVQSLYRHMKKALTCGLILKHSHGTYRIVAHHKVCAAKECFTSFLVELKDYHLQFFKSFIQAAHGRAFVSFADGKLSRKMRGRKVVLDKPSNQGRYALSLASDYLGYSIAKACKLRSLGWKKSLSTVTKIHKLRVGNDIEGIGQYHSRRVFTDDLGSYFIQGLEEVFLIKGGKSSSFYRRLTAISTTF